MLEISEFPIRTPTDKRRRSRALAAACARKTRELKRDIRKLVGKSRHATPNPAHDLTETLGYDSRRYFDAELPWS